MAKDAAIRAHEEWIGLVQPTGLVVSPTALVQAQAFVDRNIRKEQEALQRLVNAAPTSGIGRVEHFPSFVTDVLGWEARDLDENVAPFCVRLEDYGETLEPTYVVRVSPEKDAAPLLLVKVIGTGTDFDDAKVFKDRLWQASAQSRFERNLWEHNIPIGVLWNGLSLRLVSVPRGETSGHITFPMAAMCEVANRPILSALRMLLSPERLWTLPSKQRLPAILVESRKFQSSVSNALAEQVLSALSELLKGFQAADEHAKGMILGEMLQHEEGKQDIYGGLLSVLLRLVFVLYAEHRNLLPDDEVFREGYSVSRLFEKLREDAALYPDTMDQRFGAWGQLLALFRLVHDGGAYAGDHQEVLKVPRREGRLFNPDTYSFLEGRPWRMNRSLGERKPMPRVSDGVVFRVLERLLMLEGQKLSYRTLDVEQIGSVYEGLMGFRLERALGRSIAVRPQHVVVNLDELLALKGAERAKWLKENAACEVTAKNAAALKDATTAEELVAALGSRVSPRTPDVLPAGSLFLQPTDERRRSGSHYTPRSLTEPIVRTALEPILARLDEEAADKKKGPTPDAILELKLCDPAMGSGAFLVEACRQLAERLVDAWTRHAEYPDVPPDEAPLLHAMRRVATRCLYGVDKNPFAVELAKLSLWLATLAKDHPFTFVDHSLKCGDSLVGLTKKQIANFTWEQDPKRSYAEQWIEDALKEAEIDRRTIARLGDTNDNHEKRLLLKRSDDALEDVRLIGDACIAAFFSSTRAKDQREERERLLELVLAWQKDRNGSTGLRDARAGLQATQYPVSTFHWEIEFTEVFDRTNGGFDAIVGNPPFLGGKRISTVLGGVLPAWLSETNTGSNGNADLVVYFFRRAFALIRHRGTLGLVTTNTIAQGDTRRAGLKWLVDNGAAIFAAVRRRKWPGLAAVVVSVVHISKGASIVCHLDGRVVEKITAFLFDQGSSQDPRSLLANANIGFIGYDAKGDGFLFDDSGGGASSFDDLALLLAGDRRNSEIIFPYIGGEEINTSPSQDHHRYSINFWDRPLSECQAWPDALRILEEKVRPERAGKAAELAKWPWWQFWRTRGELRAAVSQHASVFCVSRVTTHLAFARMRSDLVFSDAVVVFAATGHHFFSLLQARPHEIWARFFASSMKDDMRYTPSDCFETFPFPAAFEGHAGMNDAGKRYNAFRAALMVKNNEGLTKTYNRFHTPEHDGTGVEGRNPSEVIADINELRRLHDEMDRAVLDAYGWTDIRPTCEFLLDYEEEEEEAEDGKRRKKKPWRYRWPDDVRDEVLARLLELNRQRAEEERVLGNEGAKLVLQPTEPAKAKPVTKGKSKRGKA